MPGAGERHGAGHTDVRVTRIGGLVMTGMALPAAVAAGVGGYDARQCFVEERERPLAQQSTSTLLLSLRAALGRPLTSRRPDSPARALAIWSELAVRGVATGVRRS